MSHVNPVRLADYAAGDSSHRDEIARHVDGCADCRRILTRVGGARAALREIAEAPEPALSQISSARLEAALRWSGTQATAPSGFTAWLSEWRARIAIGFATTAAAAAGVGLYLHSRHATPSQLAELKAPVHALAVNTPPVAARRSGLVTLIAGEATVRHAGGTTERVTPALALAAGDTITTPATPDVTRVGFQWSDGSGALVGAGSEITLARLDARAQELGLSRGSVAVRVGPRQPGESLRVVTPDHVITVHGTWFVVGADARGTTVDVLEGVIEVSTPDGKETTRVVAPMHGFFAGNTPGHEAGGVSQQVHAITAHDATALRASSEMGLLPWKDDSGIGGLLGATGVVDIRSEPPASGVAVDGVSFGASPLLVRRPLGRHLIELSRVGFSTVSRWTEVGPEPGELRATLPASRPVIAPTAADSDVLRTHSRQAAKCYEHALKLDPDLGGGKVELSIAIAETGRVSDVRIVKDYFSNDALEECLRSEVKRWSFPRARNTSIDYTFAMHPR